MLKTSQSLIIRNPTISAKSHFFS